MEKFTKLESAIIIASLNQGMATDLAAHKEVEESGKTPIMTEGFIKQTYADLVERIQKMSRKND